MTSAHNSDDHSYAIRQEIQRFESVHPSIYAIYDLIDLISDSHVAKQIREHVVAIEGTFYNMSQHFSTNFTSQIQMFHVDST